jgi:hypothetical protein
MTRTNWSRFSKLLLGLLVLVSAVAPAGAVSVDTSDVPGDAQVGEKVTATATLTDLYKDPQLEKWTLNGSTDLESVTWTVTYYDQTDAKVGQDSFDGQNFSGATVDAGAGIATVEVKVTGTAPEVESYSYDPAQSFTVMSLEQTREGGATNDIDAWSARAYTEESQSARDALDAAAAAIDEAGNPDAAEEKFSQAVDAYESENFELATELANEAESQANSVQKASQRNRLLMYAGAGVFVLGLAIGGFVWYRSQQQTYDKLG